MAAAFVSAVVVNIALRGKWDNAYKEDTPFSPLPFPYPTVGFIFLEFLLCCTTIISAHLFVASSFMIDNMLVV